MFFLEFTTIFDTFIAQDTNIFSLLLFDKVRYYDRRHINCIRNKNRKFLFLNDCFDIFDFFILNTFQFIVTFFSLKQHWFRRLVYIDVVWVFINSSLSRLELHFDDWHMTLSIEINITISCFWRVLADSKFANMFVLQSRYFVVKLNSIERSFDQLLKHLKICWFSRFKNKHICFILNFRFLFVDFIRRNDDDDDDLLLSLNIKRNNIVHISRKTII